MAGGSLWLATYVLPLFLAVRSPHNPQSKSKAMTLACLLLIMASLLYVFANFFKVSSEAEVEEAIQGKVIGLNFSENHAQIPDASDIFVVNGTSGNDEGIKKLIELMNANGMPFYAQNSSSGIIGNDDVVIIKVNSQWDERGGTNTDLVKALIMAILDHPEGFSGEVVIADNGQAQYGSTGRGGSLSYAKNNAEDTSQSMQKVADSFLENRVSAYLWDDIASKRVKEYAQGDLQDGYIVDGTPSPRTGIVVTYPKFKTKYNTNVSFKMGVWNPVNGTYDSKRLKVINVPVLKSHGEYGVTASVKHYMGVVSDKLSRAEGGRAHNSVGMGGMGTEMAQTRFPALNILDAIWVNANPGSGPSTSYSAATKTSAIAASTDPIALDYWAAKNILMSAAQAQGYSDLSSIDPDYISPRSFGDWLGLSMDEIRRAGYHAAKEESGIIVHTTQLKG